MFFLISFFIFGICLTISIIYLIRLLIPVHVAYLDPPRKYSEDIMAQTEELYPGQYLKINDSLEGSYILEINAAINNNFSLFRRKSSFYYNSMLFALLSVLPYIVCIGFHMS